ncbi:MAG TPA: serine/threonine-protein kinase [Vineibacter sp.]|nr:serine/threonine-protein kinase [Vineibacter sp.]
MTEANSRGGGAGRTLNVGARVGAYQIDGVLRHDECSVTYLAHAVGGGEFALKEYLPNHFAVRDGDAGVVPRSARLAGDFGWGCQRFLAEARAMAKLAKPPGLIEVHTCLEANGTAYMVMARLRGETLASTLARRGPLSPIDVDRLLAPLLDGLECLHANGLLHLGIKPANIVIDQHGDPRLVDVGWTRAAMAERMASPETIHTAGYAALEQFSDRQCGPQTDIYALAATLYQCVTGNVPLPAIMRFMDSLPPAAQAAADGHAPGLLAGIDAGLALRMAERPSSIAAWRNVFSGLAPGEPQAAANTNTQAATMPADAAVPVPEPGAARPGKTDDVDGGRTSSAPVRRVRFLGLPVTIAAFAAGSAALVVGVYGTNMLRPRGEAGGTPQHQAKQASREPAADHNAEAARLVDEATAVAHAEAKRRAAAEAERRTAAEAAHNAAMEDARRLAEERARIEAEAARKADAAAPRKPADDARRQGQAHRPAAAEPQRQAGAEPKVDDARLRPTPVPAAPASVGPAKPDTTLRATDEANAAAQRQAAADARRQDEIAERGQRMSPRERRRVHVALTALGFDTNGVDEEFGPRARQMIAAWQRRQGAPETGYLTVAQWSALRRQAGTALASYDDEEDRIDQARRTVRDLADIQEAVSPPPDVPSAPANPAPPPVRRQEAPRPSAPVEPSAAAAPGPVESTPAAPILPAATPASRLEEYRGTGRIALYGGTDPNLFAEYTLTLKVTGGAVNGTVTRHCPNCSNRGSDQRVFACRPTLLRDDRTFNLTCDGVFAWGSLQQARIHYSATFVDLALSRVGGAGG